MKINSILLFFLFLVVLNAGITSQIIQRDGILRPDTVPQLFAGCTKLNKTTTFDDQTQAIINISYVCLECSQQWNNGQKLSLIKLVNGSQRCIRQMFTSEGCIAYEHLPYVGLLNYKLDEDSDPNYYPKPFTCAICPIEAGYRIITKNAINYPQLGQNTNDINFYTYQDYRKYYGVDVFDVKFCIKESNLESGCDVYSGTANLMQITEDAFYPLPGQLINATTRVCSQCSEGFLLSSGCTVCDQANNYMRSVEKIWTCIKKTVHCLDYQNTDVCKVCQKQYNLENGQCSNCAVGYRPSDLSSGTCVQAVKDCVVYSSDVCIGCIISKKLQNGACINCADGYQPSQIQSGTCIPKIKDCISYSADVCTNCIQSKKLQNGACINCASGYRFSDIQIGICVLEVNNCLSYSSDVCTNCIQSKKLQNGACINCADGYRPSDVHSGTCVPVIKDCSSYSLDICTSCITSKKLQNGACINCASGYRLSDITIGFCVMAISGCSTYQNDLCTSCIKGYRLSQKTLNQCIQQVPFCSSYSNDICQQCPPGYDFPSDIDRSVCSIQTTILNCKKIINPSPKTPTLHLLKCSQCQPGYHLNQDFTKCYKNIPNCSINVDQQCFQCNYGYYLNLNTKKQCILNPKCPSDDAQYIYEPINGKCIQIDINCKNYSSDSGECYICKQNYKLENNKCIKMNLSQGGRREDNSSDSSNSKFERN